VRVDRQNLPPSDLLDDQTRGVVSKWREAAELAKSADRRLVAMERGSGRAQAAQRDAEALAASIQADEPPPAPKFVREFENELETARRERAARALVESALWADLEAQFADRDGRIAEAAKALEQKRSRWIKAVRAAAAAHAELETAHSMWVFERTGVFRAGGAYIETSEITLPPMDADTGGLPVSRVLAALEATGQFRSPHPPGSLPAVLGRDLEPGEHTPLWAQGRISPIVPATGPARR
jgi:hypothetical protein